MLYPSQVMRVVKDRGIRRRFYLPVIGLLALLVVLTIIWTAGFRSARAATRVTDRQIWTGSKTIDGDLVIASGGEITGNAGQYNQNLHLKVRGNLTIERGGQINFSGLGSQGGDPTATNASGRPNSCRSAATTACAGGDYSPGISGGGGGGYGGGGGGAGGGGSRAVNEATRGAGGGGYFGLGGTPGNDGTNTLSNFDLTPNLYGVVGGGGATNVEGTKWRGGVGGGAVYIEAENITINGVVRTDGESASNSVGSGGGAGTLVVVAKKNISGSGQLTSNGGDGITFANSGGAGGGGVIAARYAISKSGSWETNSGAKGGVAGSARNINAQDGKVDILQGLPTGVGGDLSIIKKTFSSDNFSEEGNTTQIASFNSGSTVYVKLIVYNSSDGTKSVDVLDEKIPGATAFGGIGGRNPQPDVTGDSENVRFNDVSIDPGNLQELFYQFKAP